MVKYRKAHERRKALSDQSQILALAKLSLINENLTSVLYDGKEYIKSTKRGVSPLLTLVQSDRDFSAFCAADKVTGKAAAFLYVLLGVKVLYTKTVSAPALEVLDKYGIQTSYDTLCPSISNRAKDGLCPMEQCVMKIDSPTDAKCAIEEKLKALTQSSHK